MLAKAQKVAYVEIKFVAFQVLVANYPLTLSTAVEEMSLVVDDLMLTVISHLVMVRVT